MSLCVEEDIADDLRQNDGGQIGLDVGLKEFCMDNQRDTVANPKPLRRLGKKLTKAQRKLSRRKFDSQNRNSQRIALARAIADVSWGEFFRQLQYKAFLYGCEVLKVPTFYPSSQTCCTCGYKNPLTKDLSVRRWRCPICGTAHDRDQNAAINILHKAFALKNSA